MMKKEISGRRGTTNHHISKIASKKTSISKNLWNLKCKSRFRLLK
jgi:hypothetical protein